MTAEEVTRALGGHWHGTYGTARCPCHDDHKESLSITDGEITTLYKCFVGCASSDIAKNVAPRLNGAGGNGHDHELVFPEFGKPTYVHRYFNPDKTLRFIACRFEWPDRDKEIRYAVPDGNGWRWKIAPGPRPPYRLLEAIAETDAGILIVEGEKKADIAAKLFLDWVVVGWCGGASAWAKTDWSMLPAGRRIAIWPDNDPPGIKAAQGIAGKIGRGRIVDVAALNLPAKFDLGDPIPSGLDPEAIVEATKETTPSNPAGKDVVEPDAPPWEPPGETAPADKPRFVLQPFNEIRAPMAPYYLVKGILPRRGLTVIWGPPKCGKSFWILDLGLHVALGWSYRDRKVKAGSVVYVACEGGEQFGARIEAFRQEKMAESLDFDVPFYLIAGSLDLIREHKRLAFEIAAVCPNPALVVIDTVNRSLDGSEVDDMPAYIKAADFLGANLVTNVTVVHHCGVAGERPRGHTSLTGNADAQIAVKKSDSGLVTATVEYMKDGQTDAEITSRIRKIELGPDTDGDPRDSCVIDPAEDPVPAATRNRIGGNQATALAIIADAMPDGLTVDELNTRLRDAGIGKSRTATLVEIRLALKAKKLTHEYAGRWYITPH